MLSWLISPCSLLSGSERAELTDVISPTDQYLSVSFFSSYWTSELFYVGLCTLVSENDKKYISRMALESKSHLHTLLTRWDTKGKPAGRLCLCAYLSSKRRWGIRCLLKSKYGVLRLTVINLETLTLPSSLLRDDLTGLPTLSFDH